MEKVVNQVQNNEHKETVDAAKTAEFKAKKAAAAKAWKERKDKEAAERTEVAKKFLKFIEEKKLQVPAEFTDMLNGLANPAARHSTGASTNNVFTKLFGAEPKVGDTVQLLEAFRRTLLDKSKLDRHIKAWAEKGIVVEFEAKPNMLESTYKLVKLA